ncbi:Transposable element Tcb1 transposase [Anabarilius grahami]|uniref:Transposable element Tcb1 transposase n=1 Tax=Anabarilius grahami TaxID=495550 RepID=A0A3N0YL84_ANAGA|nr:Transposable element Tcb1 transposase [Anabarilius grahami]
MFHGTALGPIEPSKSPDRRAEIRRHIKMVMEQLEEVLAELKDVAKELREAKWKTVLWSDESKFEVLFGKLGRHVIRTKEDKDNPSGYQRSVQKPASLMVWGCLSACGMGSLHIWKGTINAERYIQVLEQNMLPSRRRLFQGRPCIFQHDNARPHTASITTSWLRRRIRVLKWPVCSPDLSPIENIWRIIKRKMRQRRPKTVEQLEACIRQE